MVFIARYEASMHGSMTIETQHLLLGLVRENKNLLTPFFSGGESEIRQDIEDAVRRLGPRAGAIDGATVFSGWSRMAAPISYFK